MKRLLLTALVALALVPSSFAIIDSNENGISDLWEKDHNNGELFPETFDPQADPDADGWTNVQEAAAGTNPFDPKPPDGIIRPDIVHSPAVMDEDEWGPYVATPEAVTVSWPTLAGKQYTLLFSPDLSDESWILIGSPFVGNGNVVEYGFQTGDSDKRFWRVAVSDIDTDGDGLTDIEESSIGSSIYLADTDGDGIDDSAAYALGMDPSGDGSDSDGDGIPDNELYSVVFEVQHESHSMPYGVGFEAFGNPDDLHRYLTYKDTEKYSVSGSASYSSVTDGEHVWTSSHLLNGSIPADGQPVSFGQGITFYDWKSSHGTTLGQGESLHTETTVTTVDGPTITAVQIKTVTTETTPWTVKKNGSVVRSGTETITITEQFDLSDEVTYQDLWNNHVKARPWDESPPSKYGPLEWMDYNRAYFGDAEAAEYMRDRFQNSDFGIFGNVSSPGTAYSDYGSDDRVKSLRWRWIKFNPQSPFGYDYATPPAAVSKSFHLLVSQVDFLDTREWSGNDPLVDEIKTKGIVEIECAASEGTSDWQIVPLTKFDSYKIEDPSELSDFDFSKRGYSQVWIGNLPAQIIPEQNSVVSADDHSVSVVFQMGDGWSESQQDSSIEWQIESGDGGSLSETETQIKDGLTAVTLNTSTIKGTRYVLNARIKAVGATGDDISGASPWIKSPEIEVIAGTPHTFAFTATKSSYRSDGTDTSEITAVIEDQYGNLVEDDTSVSWSVGESSTLPFVSMEEVTVDGIAKAVLRAPLIPDDQIVTCSAGAKEGSTTVAVTGVTGSLAGNVSLDIGAAQQSALTVTAQAADGTPVYWTTSNGEISSESSISNGAATATLSATDGRLGAVVVTATVGDHLFFTEGQFSSSAGLAIGADHPVLIANATTDGVHTPTFAHGIARQIPYYASTPIRIKGPPGGLAQLTVEASIPVGSWAFDEVVGGVTPSVAGVHGMVLTNVSLDEEVMQSGMGSIFFDGTGSGSVSASTEFDFTDQFNATIWLRPNESTAATLAAKNGSWHIDQLSDGRIQASVITGTGTHTATTVSSITLDQWTLLAVDFRFNRLQIKLDNVPSAKVATTGSIAVTTSSIEVGAGYDGYLDNLTLRGGGNAGSHVAVSGLGAGNTLQLDALGEGTFTVTSTGAGDGDTSIRIFSKVNPEAETEVVLVDPGIWDYTCDTVASFFGGDPSTNAGTVSSIAGGFLVVGDIGSCTKNLWRMAGWSDKKPNYVELSLGGLGILTTFAEVTVVGAPADAGVASVKTLAIRFGDNPKALKFLTVFVEQIKNAVVGRGGFGWAEANFLKKMVTDIPVSDAFKLFMHDDGLARAAVRATEKLGANAESFYQGVRRAVASHGEESAKKFVQVFEGLGNEALDALKNAPAGELNSALDGLAKLVNKGIAPFTISRVIGNKHIYTSGYKRTDLLKDLGTLENVPGIESAFNMLKINHRNVKGFRYEIEGAAALKRSGETIHSISTQVSVIWDDIAEMLGNFGVNFGRKTDIDVITGVGNDLIYRQFKLTAAAMKSPKKVQAWCEKARKARLNDQGDYTGLIFHLPPDEIPKIAKSVKGWLDSKGIPITPINMTQ